MLIKQMFLKNDSNQLIPAFLNNIVDKCLSIDSLKRPTFEDIYNQLERSFSNNYHIQKYKYQIEGEMQCPISFYRIPKVIVKSPRLLIKNDNENQEFDINLLLIENFQEILGTVDYDRNIKLIMLCGKYQSGKSTFLRKITGNGAFYSGKGVETTTMGIIIDGPYYRNDLIERIKIKSFKQVDQLELESDPAIFFIDSQGFGDEEFQYYSNVMKKYLSFFCTLSDLCINITDMAEHFCLVDEILNTIRRGQMMKINNDKNRTNQDNNDFNKEITKIIFLVRSVNELNQPINTKREFDMIQKDFQTIWNSQHQIISNSYLFNLSKAVPLGNPFLSLITYNCSVWNSIPYIFSSLNNSVDNTKDYFQIKIENAAYFLFTDFFEKFSSSLATVDEQITSIASISLQLIDSIITKYMNKLTSRKETIESILQTFNIIKNLIIPFIIGNDTNLSFGDYNQYSYDLMKDITAYLEKNIPTLEKNLFTDMIDMIKGDFNQCIGGGIASISSPVIVTTAFNAAKEIMIEAGERVLLATIPGMFTGPAVAVVTAASFIISIGSYFGWFLQKYISKKKEIEKILKKKMQISIPFLWEKADNKKKKKIEILSFNKVKKVHSKVKEIIIVLESTKSNFMKFIIQCMTGVKCNYDDDLNEEKESILYGPFKPKDLMANISRCHPKFESRITNDIHILYLRGFSHNDLKQIEPVQARSMFFLSSVKSIDEYPTILNKPIHLFYFIQESNIALLRKQDCVNMQINLENKIQERQYRITYWPIFMKDHDYFDDIGPQTNKSLRWAFHQLLKKKENQIDIDV